VRDEVRRLEPRQFVRWDDARGELTRFTDPRVWFVPLVEINRPTPTTVLPEGHRVGRSTLFEDE
jgi:hypothetical protein